MLYGYPTTAIADNWLHDCLIEILTGIYESVLNGRSIPTWPTIIPQQYRAKLKSKHGLKRKIEAYTNAYKNLNDLERLDVYTAFSEQNKITDLLAGRSNCTALQGLPESIQDCIIKLFRGGFDLLTELGIHDNQYKIIYENSKDKICPFCGFEYFDGPGAPREDLDHYLLITKYSFAGVNLANLVPMGPKCNQNYKGTEDILFTQNGVIRRAFYPFSSQQLFISLDQSVPFGGVDGRLPEWHLEFIPDSEEILTWDSVFHIKERYIRDALNPNFLSWLDHFKQYCSLRYDQLPTENDVLDALDNYIDLQEYSGMSDRAFLKAAVFRMVLFHCKNGDTRLLTLVMGIVTGQVSRILSN